MRRIAHTASRRCSCEVVGSKRYVLVMLSSRKTYECKSREKSGVAVMWLLKGECGGGTYSRLSEGM